MKKANPEMDPLLTAMLNENNVVSNLIDCGRKVKKDDLQPLRGGGFISGRQWPPATNGKE